MGICWQSSSLALYYCCHSRKFNHAITFPSFWTELLLGSFSSSKSCYSSRCFRWLLAVSNRAIRWSIVHGLELFLVHSPGNVLYCQVSPPISKCISAGHQLFGQKVRGLYKYMSCIKAFSFLWLIYWDWVAIWYPVVKLKSNYCARLRLIELYWMRQISVLVLTVVCKQGVYGKILCTTKWRENVFQSNSCYHSSFGTWTHLLEPLWSQNCFTNPTKTLCLQVQHFVSFTDLI